MLTKNLKENYEFWLAMIKKEEEDQKKSTVDLETPAVTGASVNMKVCTNIS